MRRDRTWRKPHTVFADASHTAARLQSNDGDAERRRKVAVSSWISCAEQRLRQRKPRQERQLAKEQWKPRKGCKRSDAKVCGRLSAAEGPIATLPASWSVDLALSVPLGMGRRPKHVGTLTLRSTTRDHPSLSLGPYVTAVTAVLTP